MTQIHNLNLNKVYDINIISIQDQNNTFIKYGFSLLKVLINLHFFYNLQAFNCYLIIFCPLFNEEKQLNCFYFKVCTLHLSQRYFPLKTCVAFKIIYICIQSKQKNLKFCFSLQLRMCYLNLHFFNKYNPSKSLCLQSLQNFVENKQNNEHKYELEYTNLCSVFVKLDNHLILGRNCHSKSFYMQKNKQNK